ncbi:hypothetical protein MAR002J2_00064 [Escherichia phage vB_Eco_mar001J1]|uniref:Uncharacterized protein n=1 Tax=Escherichia phage vB_Eco_mar001J1 TaxID=2419760 RepID=A0A3P4A7I2_9CAUD|nr:hypothetical protein HOV61_gp64 [Escherichia phage vB_Eco_mar001J1]YP_009824728.1 hypothetical protein HOV63_gp38 [Escherichia phage vB_Eco_mar001J1]VCU43609.1 hypothetical protein MAR001J1_00038 [Escherichia phage vB_Eco_mar001J1]VCU43713.1 hypothetical protein MAR002J2_00064 [Escherichia phage vB_Eco_mar001J1]
MEQKTTKDYCDWLRELGRRLASGDIEEYKMSLIDLAGMLSGDDCYKITRSSSYSRTIINRVPEVRAAGRVSIKVEETEDDKFYVFRMVRESKRKIITPEELPAIKARAIKKLADRLLATIPNIVDLEGDKLAGACEGVSRYQDMIREIIKEEEQ